MVEQRYRAVLEVLSGIPVVKVAERYGVARQMVHRWMARYRADGIAGLADRAHAPEHHPWRTAAGVEAVICELRWERQAPMQLRQLDVTASLFLADGRECQVITGVDDHSGSASSPLSSCGRLAVRCARRS